MCQGVIKKKKQMDDDSPRNCAVTQNQCIHQCSVIASSGCICKYGDTCSDMPVCTSETSGIAQAIQILYIEHRRISTSGDFLFKRNRINERSLCNPVGFWREGNVKNHSVSNLRPIVLLNHKIHESPRNFKTNSGSASFQVYGGRRDKTWSERFC